VSVPKIDTYQNGINAIEQNLKALDPSHAAGYDKFADTQRTLVLGHNDALDRLAALESRIPFPFAASST
jgi:hypothetical protein